MWQDGQQFLERGQEKDGGASEAKSGASWGSLWVFPNCGA